ncbi:Predicted dehydrogenase [Geoalkalibacter ferrihydriticus]|uniref:Gfo/Idh/MocA-like oxidoreductase N-terminal domain-containing protein n=2 Tax=Geoalkalibacter ferrihydriticus TaxID=392333 RepID=A0A0C2HFZ2_9BACT|nr:Gfo/Idh/MocA family oxidoreductase [Geoalkalibacter ferrihydriticus]KIH75861.1 hypothetical protein GFER_14890 [Geoalkalibacter ferrihydriticus DSM 17813]SDM86060.1 Predicted dehydrogenase [Geoalkalibacter ferrihydriticus]
MAPHLKIGLVGCGVALGLHTQAIAPLEGVRIVGLCDIDAGRLQAAGRQFSEAQCFARLADMIRECRPDVVHILTPPKTHLDLALEVIDQGCHVLVEKPMAMTVAEADRIMVAAREKNVQLCVMHNHLFDPHLEKVRNFIEKGGIGEIIGVHGVFFIDRGKMLEEGNEQPDHWIHDLPLGIFGEHATPHMLYLVLSFLGPVEQVRALKNTTDLSGRTIHGLEILLDAGKNTGHISLLDNMDYPQFMLRLFGTRGVVHLNMYDLTWTVERHRKLPKTLAAMVATVDMASQSLGRTGANVARILTRKLTRRPGHRKLISTFYEGIRSNAAPPVSGEDGREVVRVLEMIERECL